MAWTTAMSLGSKSPACVVLTICITPSMAHLVRVRVRARAKVRVRLRVRVRARVRVRVRPRRVGAPARSHLLRLPRLPLRGTDCARRPDLTHDRPRVVERAEPARKLVHVHVHVVVRLDEPACSRVLERPRVRLPEPSVAAPVRVHMSREDHVVVPLALEPHEGVEGGGLHGDATLTRSPRTVRSKRGARGLGNAA